MIWQDIVLSIGGFLFSVALLPAIKAKEKPPRSSCLLTASILTVYCAVYASLSLWLAFFSGLLTAACWWTLLVQRRAL